MRKILIANLILVFCLITCNETKAESIDNYVGKLFYYYDETWNASSLYSTNYYYITTYIDTETKERMILNYAKVGIYSGHFDTLVTNINNVYYYKSSIPGGSSCYNAIIFNNNEMKVISIPQIYSMDSDEEFMEYIIKEAYTNIYKIDNSDMNSYFSEKVDKFVINLKNPKSRYIDEETSISFGFPKYSGEEIDMRYSLYSDASYIEALKRITGNDKKVDKKVEENTKNEPTKNNAKITDLSKKIKLIDFRVCSDRDVERLLKDIDSLSKNEKEELAAMLLIHMGALIDNDRDVFYNYYRKIKNEQTYINIIKEK